MDLSVPNLTRRKSLTDYSSAGERNSSHNNSQQAADRLLEALKAAIGESDSYLQLYISRVKIEEEYVRSLKSLGERQRELDAKVDGKVMSASSQRSGKKPSSTIRSTWNELKENDGREIETRMHHIESLRQNVINPLMTFRDSQERIRKRVKADVKASSTDFEEGLKALKLAKRTYEKRCEEVELLKGQQQAIEDQRTLLSPPVQRDASLDGRTSMSSSHHSPESSGSAEPVESNSTQPISIPPQSSNLNRSNAQAHNRNSSSGSHASPPLKSDAQLDNSPGDKKQHFLIDALRSKEGWEAARKEAPKKLNALLSRMREGADRGAGGSSSTEGTQVGDMDHSSGLGALGLGQGPGSLRSSQNVALKHTKAKREADDADKLYRRAVFDLETLRIRREKTFTAAVASCVECRTELAKKIQTVWISAERSSMVVASSIVSLHEHGERIAEKSLQNLDAEISSFEARLPPIDELEEPVKYVNYWHGEEDLIFGVSLQDYSRARPPSIELKGEPAKVSPPLLVLKCIDFIETHGLDQEGIYRISARHAAIQELVHRVEKDEANFKFDPSKDEPAAVAGLLKLYLRQLPEPVLPIPWENRREHTNEREENIRNGFATLKGRIRRLPTINQVTLRVILRHLSKVASHSEKNKMTAANLAVVFGPVILSEASFETTSLAAIMEEDKTMEDLILYESVFNNLEVAGAPVIPPTLSSGQSSLLGKDAEVIYGVQEKEEIPPSVPKASPLKRSGAVSKTVSSSADAYYSTGTSSPSNDPASQAPSSPPSSSVPVLPPRPPPGTYEDQVAQPQSLPRIETDHQRSATLPQADSGSSSLLPPDVQAAPMSAGAESWRDDARLYISASSPITPSPIDPPSSGLSSATAEGGHSPPLSSSHSYAPEERNL